MGVCHVTGEQGVRRGANQGAEGADGGGVGDTQHEGGSKVGLDYGVLDGLLVGGCAILNFNFGGAAGLGNQHEHGNADGDHHDGSSGVRDPHGEKTGGHHEARDHHGGLGAHDLEGE